MASTCTRPLGVPQLLMPSWLRRLHRWATGLHATADFHRGVQLGGGKQFVITQAPSLGVRLANAFGVIRIGTADDQHS